MKAGGGTTMHWLMGAWAVLGTIAWVVGSLALFFSHPSLLTYAFAFVVIGSRAHALTILAHEAYHGNLVPNKAVNTFLGKWVCSYPIISRYEPVRQKHLAHHRMVGTPGDPDSYYWNWDLSERKAFARHLLRIFTGMGFALYAISLVLPAARGKVDSKRSPDFTLAEEFRSPREFIWLGVCQLLLLALFSFTVGPLWYVLGWLFPVLTLGYGLGTLRQFIEHREGRMFIFRSNPLERFFLGCYAFHLHAIHHKAPALPWFELGVEKERVLAEHPEILKESSYAAGLIRYFQGLPVSRA